MITQGLVEQLNATSSVTSLLAPAKNNAGSSVFVGRAIKGAVTPYVVVHLVDGPPAEASLNGVSELIDGEIQFDSYASDAITARKVSRAVRDALKNFAGALPDGTTIQFVNVTLDVDDPYELGGVGYVDRSLVRLQAFYTEAQ